MLNDLYFKTTCNIRPHFLRPMGGLKMEGSLYTCICIGGNFSFKMNIQYLTVEDAYSYLFMKYDNIKQ